MGGCFGKRSKKINPQSSDGQLINGENHSEKYENTETNIPCLDTTKNTLHDKNINSDVHVKNHDQIYKEETMKICSEVRKNSSTNNYITYGGSPSVNTPSNIQVSPQGRDELPSKAVRFDIDFNDNSTRRKFPRRLKKLEGMPQLTAEQLNMKQEMAEQKRAKELQRKTETLSKRHRDLFEAREHERLKNAQIQVTFMPILAKNYECTITNSIRPNSSRTKMEQKFLSNERNRQNHMKEVINKQREREKKAKKVREKSCLELEGSIIQVEETYDSAGDSQDEDWSGEQQPQVKFGEPLEEDSTDEFYESGGTQIR